MNRDKQVQPTVTATYHAAEVKRLEDMLDECQVELVEEREKLGRLRAEFERYKAEHSPCENPCCKQPRGHVGMCDLCGCEP